jgi:type IV secretory pathway VirD2 relaxase
MTRENEFDLEVGKIGARDRGYLQRVLHASTLAGGRAIRSKFQGNRTGRGAGIGRVLAARDRYAAFRSRRVITKARIVKLAGKGLAAAKAHLRYIQRDGVTREGQPAVLYDRDRIGVDGKEFLERGAGDRHQFRLIVSAEDAVEYEDLKPFVRRLMAQMEEDLGTRLDWVAVDHFNTGHPHSHIILRGKNDRDHDLIIAREYVSHGLRERAAEIVTFDLGPRSDLEIESRLKNEVEQERFTSLDRKLLREVGEDGVIRSGSDSRDKLNQTLRAGRLQKLRRLGLAQEIRPGQWRLDPGLEPALRRLGERGDIIRTMNRAMRESGQALSVADYAIYAPSDAATKPIIGRVAARGLSDELNDRQFVIVEGIDGRTHYIEIGTGDPSMPVLENCVVRISPKPREARHVDRTTAEIAAAHGGRYSVDIHLRHDPSATADFAETHVRRLQAMRRLSGAVEREADGSWIITGDHLERAAAFERNRARAAPVIIDTLSTLPLAKQIGADGATWLDRELTAKTPSTVRNMGFGREVNEALSRRRQWLIAQDFAREENGKTVYRANLLAVLRRRELSRVAGQLSDELGLAYAKVNRGEPIEGIYRRRIDLVSGRFALIENSREFQLVPWRPVLERHLGRPVAGIMQGDTISWTIGRQRSGPSI